MIANVVQTLRNEISGLTNISTNHNYQVYSQPPMDFKAEFEAVGCFCEFEDKVLLLKRNSDKPEGNSWGIPGGKVESNECARTAIVRELEEETGIKINLQTQDLIAFATNYLVLPNKRSAFHMFRVQFLQKPEIKISSLEHQKFQWTTVSQALEEFPLMTGEIESFIRY